MFDFMSGFRDPNDPFGLLKLAAAGAVPEITGTPKTPELVAQQPAGVAPDERLAPPTFAPGPTAARQPELLTTQGVDERRQVSAVDRYQAEIQKAMENKAWNEAIAGIAKMFPATPAPNRGPPQAPQIGRGIAPNPGDRLRGQATSQLANIVDTIKARKLTNPLDKNAQRAGFGQNVNFPRGRSSNLSDILRKLS